MPPKYSPIEPVSLPHPDQLLIIESLDYSNPYDHLHPHRHDYFEVIFIHEGNGHQLIDFEHYSMSPQQVFTIYPGQIHLMNRTSARGLLLQFRKDIFEFLHPLKHYQLYFQHPQADLPSPDFVHLFNLATHLNKLLEDKKLSELSLYKTYSYLQIILISILELKKESNLSGGNSIAMQFLSLLSQNITSRKKVNEYANLLGCNTEKLNEVCKTAFGKTAKDLIQEELLLEIRRQMVLGQSSLKEIAYDLNFDSPANFSAFVKTHTGKTPSGLQEALLGIYK